ncbi:hypothetical protein K2X89_02780, partial [Myxococcota bacterium]|nr:hypothetical protein [Myxococcota bacterium]
MSNLPTPNVPRKGPSARAHLEIGLMIALMLLVGIAGWKLSERAELEVDPSPLAGLPAKVGPWQSMDIP